MFKHVQALLSVYVIFMIYHDNDKIKMGLPEKAITFPARIPVELQYEVYN